MPWTGYAEFLAQLRDAGDLTTISRGVAPAVELAHVATFAAQSTRNPALYFERVGQHAMAVVANVWTEPQRLARALDLSRLELLEQERGGLTATRPMGWTSGLFASAAAPVCRVRSAPAQQVVRLGRDVDLWDLPIPRYRTADPFPSLALGIVCTPGENGLCWRAMTRPAFVSAAQAIELPAEEENGGEQPGGHLPVAIALGVDPALWMAARMSERTGRSLSELYVELRKTPLETATARTVELDIPASAEWVLEGELSVGAVTTGGGRPVEIRAATHRANPLWPASVPGWQHGDLGVLEQACDLWQQAWLRERVPGLAGVRRPAAAEGRVVVATVDRAACPAARRIAYALLGLETFRHARLLVLQPSDGPLRDLEGLWSAWVLSAARLGNERVLWSTPAAMGAGTVQVLDLTSSEGAALAEPEPALGEEFPEFAHRRLPGYGLS